jgi:hypothetical protein
MDVDRDGGRLLWVAILALIVMAVYVIGHALKGYR